MVILTRFDVILRVLKNCTVFQIWSSKLKNDIYRNNIISERKPYSYLPQQKVPLFNQFFHLFIMNIETQAFHIIQIIKSRSLIS